MSPQDKYAFRGMVIKDQFGDGLTLVEGSLRAVRYAPVQGG